MKYDAQWDTIIRINDNSFFFCFDDNSLTRATVKVVRQFETPIEFNNAYILLISKQTIDKWVNVRKFDRLFISHRLDLTFI